MKNQFQEPEISIVNLSPSDEIANDDYVDGGIGIESSIFGD